MIINVQNERCGECDHVNYKIIATDARTETIICLNCRAITQRLRPHAHNWVYIVVGSHVPEHIEEDVWMCTVCRLIKYENEFRPMFEYGETFWDIRFDESPLPNEAVNPIK